MGIDTVLLTRQPAAVAAYWHKLTGHVAPPCRLHPEYWLVPSTGMAIMDAAEREPGMYVNVEREHADWWSRSHPASAVERDDAGAIVAVLLPDGQRMPLIEIPHIPKDYGEIDLIGIARAVAARREQLIRAIDASGLTNGRLIGPRNYVRARFNGVQPFRLVVDGDGDLAPIDALLSDIAVSRSTVVATRASDVPQPVRYAVNRLARYLDDSDVWDEENW